MTFVKALLFLPAPSGFPKRPFNGPGHGIGIHDGLAVDIAGGAAYGLDQGSLGTQETFLVGIQDRHQGHFRHIQPLAQQVDPHQHVKFPQAQIADDLHAFHRVDIGVQVTHLDPVFRQVVGQVFRHALGQGGDQHPFITLFTQPDFRQQVIHLGRNRSYFHLRIDQAGRTNQLFDDLAGAIPLIRTRCRRDKHRLRRQVFELVKAQRPVVQCARQPETVLHQVFLARTVAAVHGAQLGNGHMALIHHQQGIMGQVIEQGRRRLAGPPA